MLECPHSSGSDDRNVAGVDHRTREREVEALACAVTVHRRQQDLAGAQLLGFRRPRDRVEARRLASAMGEHLPRTAFDLTGIDRQHDALRTELVGDVRDQFGSGHRRRVHRHLVRTDTQQPTGVVH